MKFIEVHDSATRGSEGAILVNVGDIVSIHMESNEALVKGQGVEIHLRDGRILETRTPYSDVIGHLERLGVTPDGDTA